MAEGRRGLGRGLSALLDEAGEGQGQAPAPGEGTRDLPIELVHRNPDQPRRHFPDEEIAELEASIRDKGVLQPILVRPSPKTPGEFEIVAGERRWRAAQRAGLKAIPALVRCLSDREGEVRRSAAYALGQLGPEASVAVPNLTPLTESDPDERVRRTATLSRSILLRRTDGEDHAP